MQLSLFHSSQAFPWLYFHMFNTRDDAHQSNLMGLTNRKNTQLNQMSSHLQRPIYFSFSSHCWHTVIARPCCLATKILAGVFPISCQGEAPPLKEWLKGHSTRRLVWQSKDCLFWKLWRVCVCVWETLGQCGYKTLSDEWAKKLLFLPSTDPLIEAVKGRFCYQINNGTLTSSQAECDPHWIVLLLFSDRSGSLWSSIKRELCFFRLQTES